MFTRRQLIQALGSSAALGALYPLTAQAQVDQVKVYFGFPPGSSGDTVARRVAEKWAGTPFSKNAGIVENKPGAGGRIALEALKSAPADGSVLALSQVSALANYPHIFNKMPYTDKDFAPVSIAAIMHHGLAVGPISWRGPRPTPKTRVTVRPVRAPHRISLALCWASIAGWTSGMCRIADRCPA